MKIVWFFQINPLQLIMVISMAQNDSASSSYSEPKRLSFPVDEARNQWLPMLLNTYFIADKGVFEGIRRETNKGRFLACAKGCSACCKAHTSIPIYPLEVIGLYWYIIEQIKGEVRKQLKGQLSDFKKGDPCPLLVNGACSVHPMRPQACRHFNVFSQPCEEGEDAFFTRRQDVLTPIKKYQDDALSNMLPFHKITKRAQRREAIKTGAVHQFVQVLQEVEWEKLAKRMG